MKSSFFIRLIISIFFVSEIAVGQSHKVKISTNVGDITLMLYDQTPSHRDNFMKLVNNGHFDGTLFYRVIKDFVIQGGSSDSRNAPKGKLIGYGESAITILSEFNDSLIHKKGALCAPRQPDEINMFKKSDVSQFYIAIGRVYTNAELDILENNVNVPIMHDLKVRYYLPRKEELTKLKETSPELYNKTLQEIKDKINVEYQFSKRLIFTPQQRKIYTTIGGIPDLDGEYTVFGEVISGLDVAEKISQLPVDKNNRPYQDVKIEITVLQ